MVALSLDGLGLFMAIMALWPAVRIRDKPNFLPARTISVPFSKSSVRWSAVVVLAAGFLILFVGGGSRFTIGLALKPMVDEFGWVRGDLGIAVAMFQAVSAVCSFIAGRMADRMSLRLLLTGGLAVSGLGIGLMSFTSAPWHAVLFYGVLFAIGNGAVSITPVGVMVTRAYPGRVGLANAVAISGMSVGQLVMIAALAFVLVAIGWRSVFVWVGLAHLLLIPVLVFAIPGKIATAAQQASARQGLSLREAARTRQFWLLIVIYAICGLDDFFVSTHVVALAQDSGVDALLAGNLLAMMGLTGLIGVVAAGAWSDRLGPVWATTACFAMRIAVFLLVLVDQSPLSVMIFALVFGFTFLITAPLTVVFVRESFGVKNLGAISGLITMVHQIFGGIGAYAGANIFDSTGRYDIAFAILLASSIVALVLTLRLHRTPAGGVGA